MDTPPSETQPKDGSRADAILILGLHEHSMDEIAFACRYGHQRYEDVRMMSPAVLNAFNSAIRRCIAREPEPVT